MGEMSSAQTNTFFDYFDSSSEGSTEVEESQLNSDESQTNAVFLFFNKLDQLRENPVKSKGKRKNQIPVEEQAKRQRVIDAIPVDAICLEVETTGNLLWFGNNTPLPTDYHPIGCPSPEDNSDRNLDTSAQTYQKQPTKTPVKKTKQPPENKPTPKKTSTPKTHHPASIPKATLKSRLAQKEQKSRNQAAEEIPVPPVPCHAFYCDGIFRKWSRNDLLKALETFIYFTEEVIQRQRRSQLAEFVESIEPSITTKKYNKNELQLLIRVLRADIEKHLIMKEM